MKRQICNILLSVCLIPVASFPQQVDKQQQLPPGSIDGSINPELIPDIVAYRLFFTALGEKSSSKAANQFQAQSMPVPHIASAKQKAQLAPLNLSDSDSTTLIDSLAAFRAEFDAAALPSNSKSPLSEKESQLLQTKLDNIAQNT